MANTELRSEQIKDGTITDVDVAAANKDGAVGTPSMRTLGTGAQQAAAGNDSRFASVSTVNGRLTTEAGVAISITDQVAQGNIRFTPYKGEQIDLFDGTSWLLRTFAETTLALTATAGVIYDVWGYWNSTVFGLEQTAWASATTRATALALQNGRLVKSGAPTRRYLGSYLASGTNITENSNAKRFVWNYHNRVRLPLMVKELEPSWTTDQGTWRYAAANPANKVEVVIGVIEDMLSVECKTVIGDLGIQNGIGVNSTSIVTGWTGYSEGGTFAQFGSAGGKIEHYPRLGYSEYAWLERTLAGKDTNFYSTAGDANNWGHSGIFGSVMG